MGDSCQDNLACSTGLICNATEGVCVTALETLVSCSTDSDCGDSGSTCVCSPTTGMSFCFGPQYLYNPCTSETINLSSCMTKNECVEYSSAPNSCCMLNCENEYNQINTCQCTVFSQLDGSCMYNPLCK
jgi:hypothetical protein